MGLWSGGKFLIKFGAMALMVLAVAGCDKGRKLEKLFPPASEAKIDKELVAPSPEAGWEEKFEEFLTKIDMAADRYEWQAPVKGAFRTVKYARNRVTAVDNVAWFGCGWAHYSEPPQGVPGSIVKIAAVFQHGSLAAVVLMNQRAGEACRFAPSAAPTNEEGALLPIPVSSTPVKATEKREHFKVNGFRAVKEVLVGQIQQVSITGRDVVNAKPIPPEVLKKMLEEFKAKLDAEKSTETP